MDDNFQNTQNLIKTKLFIFLFLITFQLSAQAVVADALLLMKLETALYEINTDTAISHTHLVYQQARQQQDSLVLNKSLWQLSDLYLKQKNSIQALKYGLEILAQKEDGALENEHIGNIYLSENIYSAALTYYQKAFLNQEGKKIKLSLIEKIAATFLSNHQLDSAAIFYQAALNFHAQNDSPQGEIRTLQQLAKIADLGNDCKTALTFYQKIEYRLDTHSDKKELSTLYNNLGYQYHCSEEYEMAIKYFEQAEKICRHDCSLDKTTLYTNLGIAFFNNKEFPKAILNLEKGLNIAQQNKDSVRVGSLENLLAKIFLERGELYEALLHNDLALGISKDAQANDILKNAYLTEANIYERLYEFDKALSFYQLHLELRDSLLLADRLRQEKLLQRQFSLEQSDKEIKLLLINQKVQNLAFEQLTLEKNNLELATAKTENELTILRREQEINDEKRRVEELQSLKSQQELSLTRQRLLALERDGQILNLEQKEAQQTLELVNRRAAEKDQQQEIEILNKDKILKETEIEKQAAFRQLANWIFAALSVILLLILGGYIFARKTNRKLEKQKTEIETQKQEIEIQKLKSEELLLNILPAETARELIENGTAKPQQYDKVSVLFADFVSFTRLAEQMSPSELIEELNACFIAFDEIGSRHNLEKIKTIGDAYMCAGGIPVANDCHAQNTVDAALEMMDFIEKRYQKKQEQGQSYWRMRIGIHTGPVVAGVVGSKKFAYDIWGDTVNIASRMESNSIAGKINISKDTFEALSSAYFCESRGELSMKNRGNAEMFFVSYVN